MAGEQLDKAIRGYLSEIPKNLPRGKVTEHPHRAVLDSLVETFVLGITAPDEPAHVERGAPDFVVSHESLTVNYLVEMLEPYKGLVCGPCCGPSAMFVQSEGSIGAHGTRRGHISIYGQGSDCTTWRLPNPSLLQGAYP